MVMETLNRLSLKLLAKHGYSTTVLPSRSTVLGRSSFGFSGSLNLKKLGYGHSDLFRAPDASMIMRSHVASDVAEGITGLDTEVSKIQKSNLSKTVHLRFQVQKKCRFGEQLFLVGDDPMMGLWDPFSAIPLSWSEGNVWVVELDAPVDLTMQFKFMLKLKDGEMVWQPGPDRIFKTWESSNTLVIEEDWENAEAQKIIEEPFVDDDDDDGMLSADNAYLKDQMNVSYEFVDTERTIHAVEGYLMNEEEETESAQYVDKTKNEAKNNNNDNAESGKNPTAGEDKETMIGIEEGRTLRPGLAAPLQEMAAENELTEDHESITADASVRIDAGEDHSVPK